MTRCRSRSPWQRCQRTFGPQRLLAAGLGCLLLAGPGCQGPLRYWRADDSALRDSIVQPQPWDAQLRRSAADHPSDGRAALASNSREYPSHSKAQGDYDDRRPENRAGDSRGGRPNPYGPTGRSATSSSQRWDQQPEDPMESSDYSPPSDLPAQYEQLARQQARAVEDFQRQKHRARASATPEPSRSAPGRFQFSDREAPEDQGARYSMSDNEPSPDESYDEATEDRPLYADTGLQPMVPLNRQQISEIKAPPRQSPAQLARDLRPRDTGAGNEVRILPLENDVTSSRQPGQASTDARMVRTAAGTPEPAGHERHDRAAAVQPASGQRPIHQVPVDQAASNGPNPSADTHRKLSSYDHLVAALKSLDEERPSDPTPVENLNYEMKKKHLHMILGQQEQALEPIEGLPAAAQEYFRYTFQALHEAADPKGHPDLSRRWPLVLNSNRDGLTHMATLSPLEVKNAAFCSNVDGFGALTRFPTTQFQAGQELLLYCEIDNFISEQVKDGYETKLQGNYEIVDAGGVRVADVLLPQEVDICKRPRRDYFFVYRIYMPQKIEPGRYQLRLTIEDMKGKKFGQSSLEFQIVSK